MSIQVGINGYGRIGRVLLRILSAQSGIFDIRAINLRRADLAQMVYFTKYDSVFRRFDGTVETDGNDLIVNGKHIRVFSESDAARIPWGEVGAEYVVDTTGVYLTTEAARAHLVGGARKVILSAPAQDDTPLFVMGVNQSAYRSEMQVVSNASCTTNCLAPLAKVVHEAFGIEEGLMSTIHASTSKQRSVDDRAGSDWRIGRSVYGNIIPSSTGAAKAVGKVIPALAGKLTGTSFRVPAPDASVVDLTVRLEKSASYADICAAVRAASEGELAGILRYTSDELVSADVIGDPCPCVFDEKAGVLLNDHFVKLVAWYDNEWGYTSNLCRLLRYVAQEDQFRAGGFRASGRE